MANKVKGINIGDFKSYFKKKYGYELDNKELITKCEDFDTVVSNICGFIYVGVFIYLLVGYFMKIGISFNFIHIISFLSFIIINALLSFLFTIGLGIVPLLLLWCVKGKDLQDKLDKYGESKLKQDIKDNL